MKNLTKVLFCIFAINAVVSCEPEDLDQVNDRSYKEIIRVEPFSDTGEQGEIFDDEKK